MIVKRICKWALSLLVLASCSDDVQSPNDGARPLGQYFSVSGSVPLSVPSTNLNAGTVPWTGSGITIPAGEWVHISVEGGVSITANPDYTASICTEPACVPLDGETAYALGVGPFSELRVSLRIRHSDGSTTSLSLMSQDSTSAHGYAHLTVPGELQWSRSGVSGGGGGAYTVPAYLLSSSQYLEVESGDPVSVTAVPTEVHLGDTVTYTAVVNNLPIVSGPSWYYMVGDTGSTPAGVWGPWRTCDQGLKTCKHVPPASGRMYTIVSVGGANTHSVTTTLIKVLPPLPKLVVSCSQNPVRGMAVTCTSSVQPAQPFTVVLRKAVGAEFEVTDSLNASHGTGGVDQWSGIAVASSSVRIEANVLVGGAQKRINGSGQFVVGNRPWTAPQYNTVPTRYIQVQPPYMVPHPTEGTQLGQWHAGIPEFAHHEELVNSGPNEGLSYFGTRFDLPQSQVVIHPALYVTTSPAEDSPDRRLWHDWYDDQNGLESGTCTQSAVSTLRGEVERHEGYTMSANSHLGLANERFQTLNPQLDIESMYSQEGPTALVDSAVQKWQSFLNSTPYLSVQQAFDATDTPLVLAAANCTFDFDPTDN